MANEQDSSQGSARWYWRGQRIPKQEYIYTTQIILIYIIIVASVINLSLQTGLAHMWVSLMSLCTYFFRWKIKFTFISYFRCKRLIYIFFQRPFFLFFFRFGKPFT